MDKVNTTEARWKDGLAYLIEIKSKEFENSEDLIRRKAVAENYIKEKNLDWQYKVIYDTDIKLSREKTEKYIQLRTKAKTFKSKLGFIRRDKKFNSSDTLYFSCAPIISDKEITKEEYIRYVKYGKID